jgi:drug/metabolite transporter (DMT)-like permease
MKKLGIHIIAMVSMLFWGMSYIWSKIVFEFYSPLTTIFFRLLISFLSLILFIALTHQFEKIRKEDRWLFIAGALFNPFLYFIGENYGLKMVSASLSSIVVATIPLFAPFAAYYYFKEKLKPVNLAGLILSFVGLLIIILKKDFSLSADPLGLLLLFLAVFSAVFYTIFLKKLTTRYSPLTVITWQNLLGALYFLPFFLFFETPKVFEAIPDAKTLGALILLGVFASSLAYVLFAGVVKSLGVIQSSLYTNLIPVFTVIFAFYFLNESFTTTKIIGMAVVITGVVLSESGRINTREANN